MSQHKNVLYGQFDEEYPVITRGEGVYIYDEAGNRYLDAEGGVCVVNIGHGVQEIVDVIAQQARTVAYTYGGLCDNKPRRELAAKLQQWAPAGMGQIRSMFMAGGAEANEGALKLACQYQSERGNPLKRKVIGRWQSYHGNTIAALSMSGRTSWRNLPNALLLDFPHIPPPYCYRCPWGRTYPGCEMACAYELRRCIRQEGAGNIAAFIAEPVIGTSLSAVVPPPEYYPIIREICDEYDVLFIVDEVMSGVGRTGKHWAIEHWGVTPDLITASKSLSSGYSPLAALLVSEKVWKVFEAGSKHVRHSTTYGGNPLSCAVGVAVLNYLEKHDLVTRAGVMGEKLIARLREVMADVPYVGDVRGKGMFAGVELVMDKGTKTPFPPDWDVGFRVEIEGLKNGLLLLAGITGTIDGIAGDHIELVPPYTIDEGHIDDIAAGLKKSILDVVARLPI